MSLVEGLERPCGACGRTAGSGAVGVKLPALIHEFSVALADQAPHMVAKVVFIGTPDVLRKYGKLARDSANGAANAAERGH